MLCTIYRSHKKPGAFLYIPKRDDFSQVPGALMDQFGAPQLLMMHKLDPARPLASADVNKVIKALQNQGFYLQLPPPPEDLLTQNRQLLERLQQE